MFLDSGFRNKIACINKYTQLPLQISTEHENKSRQLFQLLQAVFLFWHGIFPPSYATLLPAAHCQGGDIVEKMLLMKTFFHCSFYKGCVLL